MPMYQSHESRTGVFNTERSSASKGKKAAGPKYADSTSGAPGDMRLALVTAVPASGGRATAQNRDDERGRNSAWNADEEWNRYKRENEQNKTNSDSNGERSSKAKPRRQTTFPRAAGYAERPGMHFFNEAPVQNQVGNQHVEGGVYFDDTADGIYRAHRLRQREPTQTLRRAQTNVTDQDMQHETPLRQAAFFGRVDTVKSLIRAGSNVNAHGGPFGTALQAAAVNGHTQVVILLLRAGADVNAVGGEFGNALHAAAAAGCFPTVAVLLGAGADVDAKGERYRTVMRAAILGTNNQEVVDLLISAGASVDD